MHYTNNLNLPQPIVDAVTNDDYDQGMSDISVTGLLSPPLQRQLRKKHESELVEDVSENIWALLGKSVHSILEKSGDNDNTTITERRFYHRIKDWVVGGKMDRVVFEKIPGTHRWKITDYKVTSAYVISTGSRIQEWEEQQNCYAKLLRHNDILVGEIEVVAILRDWSKLVAKRDPNYPRFQVERVPLRLWSDTEQDYFMEERVALHQQAENELIPCTDEDRWAKPAVYAVMKEGRKSAMPGGLYSDKAEAEADAAARTGGKFYVETRPARYVRCENYCNAADFCPVFRPELMEYSPREPLDPETAEEYAG